MKGTHTVVVERAKVKYTLTFKRNISFIRGNSGTGKTTLISMIRDYNDRGPESGVTLNCDVPCESLSGRRWERELSIIEDSIVFLDEGNEFIYSKDFAKAINGSSNYFATGYFDAFFYALMYAAGGPDFFNKATHYEEGIWDTPEAKTCFDIVAKLASYTNPITPAQANDQDFTQNQQLVLDNEALFMPNGTWIVGEMAEAPRADGFEWGMTALPAVKAGGDGYSYTWFEQAWIPAGAEHQDAAKQFVAYLYSDEACKLFAESGAIQPVLGIADSLEGDNKMFYSIYDNGAKAAMGNFAAFSAIPGVEVRTVFFDPVNSLVSGSMTEQQWIDGIKSASDQMRANIIE